MALSFVSTRAGRSLMLFFTGPEDYFGGAGLSNCISVSAVNRRNAE